VVVLLSILVGFLSLGLQATLVPHWSIAGIRPDLPLVAVVLLAYARGATTGTLAGFCIGLAQDLTNPTLLGLNALVKSLLGYAAGTLRVQLDATSLPMRAAVLFVSVLAHDLVYLTISTRLALSELLLGLLTRSLPTAVYTALVGMWAFAALGWLAGRGGHRRGRSALARR
jgi:rod shape-determining protein MreD